MESTIDIPPRRRANYFAEGDYLKTNVATGVTRNRTGTRMISLTADFLIGLRNGLMHECGKATDAVFKTSGKKWGTQWAIRLEKELSDYYGMPLVDFPLAMFQASLVEAFSHHGWGKLWLDVSAHHHGLLIFTVHNAIYAELVKTSEAPADSLISGILSGVFSYYADRDLDCEQTQCRACGAMDSRFIVSIPERLTPVADWVSKGTTHDEIVKKLIDDRLS